MHSKSYYVRKILIGNWGHRLTQQQTCDSGTQSIQQNLRGSNWQCTTLPKWKSMWLLGSRKKLAETTCKSQSFRQVERAEAMVNNSGLRLNNETNPARKDGFAFGCPHPSSLYIYIYIYACCEVIIWAKFGHFRCYYLGQVAVIIWAKLFLAYKNSGFKRFLAHTVIILCFFLCPIIWQLSKNSLFRKKGAKIGFFKFLCFKFIFGKVSFLGLLKHYENRGFSRFLCFLFLKEKKGKKEMITGISEFGFFCPKMAVSWRITFSPKNRLKPLFL